MGGESKTVLVFGVFDPLHEGHKYLFRQARQLGDHLLVVVARDSAIKVKKGRDSFEKEAVRLKKVMALECVDEGRLGNEWPAEDPYQLLSALEFDVLALGYDQRPDDITVQKEMDRRGKGWVKIERIGSFKPEKYKSSYFRPPANF